MVKVKMSTYEDLVNSRLDETADRDIEIGYQNSLAVAKDLPNTIDKVLICLE